MVEKRCVKCGREAADNQAFCAECLAEMDKYPVKPGVVVLLPPREYQTVKPAGRRRHPMVSLEEQVQKLKTRITALTLALMIALGAAGGLGWVLLQDYLDEKDVPLLPGQNYSSEQTQTPGETN